MFVELHLWYFTLPSLDIPPFACKMSFKEERKCES